MDLGVSYRFFVGTFALAVVVATQGFAATVTKVAESFEGVEWRPTTAVPGSAVSSVEDAAPANRSERSIKLNADFTKSPDVLAIVPPEPLVIPGRAKMVSLWLKSTDARYGIKVAFKDGWGRDGAAGKPFVWTVPNPIDGGKWNRVTFAVPSDWVSPIEVTRITIDNSRVKAEKQPVEILIDELEVETDVTHVDPKTGFLTTWTPEPAPANPKAVRTAPLATDLIRLSLGTSEQGNVFAGVKPIVRFQLHNWNAGQLNGTLKYTLADENGRIVQSESRGVTVDSTLNLPLSLKANRFGLYQVDAHFDAGGVSRTERLALANIPAPRELTEAQKLASPYGINHYGNVGMMIKPFRKAGIIWVRDYGFGFKRLQEARGDGSFTRWPFFAQVLKEFADADMKVVAVLQRSITKPKLEGGKPVGPLGPDAQWTRMIAGAITAFPQMKYWEASNEYDLPADNSAAERAVNWENYGLFHAKLADLVKTIQGPSSMVIENGRAGIFPALEEQIVKSGHFDKVDVINSHYYTGTETPEESTLNYNTHTDSFLYQEKGSFYDQLRAATRAGRSDGKMRQHWLTEFGWDTLAGPVVSPYEQAVFLQRGWMLAMAAGVEKSFWFYNFDEKTPRRFFDGCGLFTAQAQPKLSLAAMAGMSWVLPSPRYVGMISAGDNTAGYVFEQDDKLVAAIFSIRGDGPVISIESDRLYDYLGNAIDSSQVKLSMAPTYAVGLKMTGLFYKQSAYSLDTPYLISATPRDEIRPIMRVANARNTPIDCAIAPVLPDGWTATSQLVHVSVPAGETKLVELPVRVGASEERGMKIVRFAINEEGDQHVKDIALRVGLQPSVQMRVGAIIGEPGDASIDLRIGNNAATSRNGKIALSLPSTWKAEATELAVEEIKPGEARNVPIRITWSDEIPQGETAIATFTPAQGPSVSQPLIPNRSVIREVSGIALDGELGDWSEATQVPGWMLGSTTGEVNARVNVGWAKDGLYVAVDLRDSKVVNGDPRSFWTGDVLEVYVDTSANKQSRPFGQTDHQFWFVPLPEKGAVYAGRWKVDQEIAETQFDIAQVKGASRRTADGYTMEFLLPTSILHDFRAEAGRGLGINLNLTVSGTQQTREVFWPRNKSAGVQKQQQNWGSMTLVK